MLFGFRLSKAKQHYRLSSCKKLGVATAGVYMQKSRPKPLMLIYTATKEKKYANIRLLMLHSLYPSSERLTTLKPLCICANINLPSSLVEHVDLVAGAVGISEHQTWSNDVEGSINVHGVWIFEGNDVQSVLVSQVATHPFNAKVVCYLMWSDYNVQQQYSRHSLALPSFVLLAVMQMTI